MFYSEKSTDGDLGQPGHGVHNRRRYYPDPPKVFVPSEVVARLMREAMASSPHEPRCRCSELGPPYHREDPPWRPGEPAPIADRRLISVAGRDYCASCALPMVQR